MGIRDRPELLMKIFRIRKIESSENQQIKALENEVHRLKKYIFEALKEIKELKSRINRLEPGAENKIKGGDERKPQNIVLNEKQDPPVLKNSPEGIQESSYSQNVLAQDMKILCSKERKSSETDTTLSANQAMYGASSLDDNDSCYSGFRRPPMCKQFGANDKLFKATLDILNTNLEYHSMDNNNEIPEENASSEKERESVVHGGEDGSVSEKKESKSRKRPRDEISQLPASGPENYQFPANESVDFFKKKFEKIDPELSAIYSDSIAMLPESMRHRFAGNFFFDITNEQCLRKKINGLSLLTKRLSKTSASSIYA